MDGTESDKLPFLFLCHGSANVGQLANDAAREIFKEGKARIACIAAVGARNPDFIKPFRSGKVVYCVDGCQMRCASKTLEFGKIPIQGSMVVTDIGIEKNHDLNLQEKEVTLVKCHILKLIDGAQRAGSESGGPVSSLIEIKETEQI